MTLIRKYGIYGLIRIFKNLIFTKIFFPNAKLVRFPIYIRGKSLINFGEGLTTGVNVRLDAFKLADRPLVFNIGNHVQLNDSVHIGAVHCVTIGDHTLIASRVFISDHNHGRYGVLDLSSDPRIPPIDRPLVSSPVHIGSNVWIGEQVCILPGVTIGNGAVIGANSVVTKDIPGNSIAVGNPAKVIRIFDLQSSRWVEA